MIRYASTALAGLLLGTLLVFSCFHIGVATVHADTPALLDAGSSSGSAAAAPAASVPDPTTDPGAALSTATKLYKSGAWLCLGIVVLFVLLRYASAHLSWLKAPNRAHYVSIALGGLALLAVPASQGTSPNLQMLLAALGGTFALMMPGLVPKPASS